MRKRVIFDTMSELGRERILRIGYENWDPFQEPKEPADLRFGKTYVEAESLLREFFEERPDVREFVAVRRELFDLCVDLIRRDARAGALCDFCDWYRKRTGPR